MVHIEDNRIIIECISASPKEDLVERKKSLIQVMRHANNNDMPVSKETINMCLDMLDDMLLQVNQIR